MRRREFITLLGGSAVAWPFAACAQQSGRLPTIGFLGVDASIWSPWTAAFVGRLRELGWIEGRTIAIEYRWAEGRPERNAEIAAESATCSNPYRTMSLPLRCAALEKSVLWRRKDDLV